MSASEASPSNTWIYASAAITAAAVGYHVYNKNTAKVALLEGSYCRV